MYVYCPVPRHALSTGKGWQGVASRAADSACAKLPSKLTSGNGSAVLAVLFVTTMAASGILYKFPEVREVAGQALQHPALAGVRSAAQQAHDKISPLVEEAGARAAPYVSQASAAIQPYWEQASSGVKAGYERAEVVLTPYVEWVSVTVSEGTQKLVDRLEPVFDEVAARAGALMQKVGLS